MYRLVMHFMLIVLALLIQSSQLSALDMEGAKESPCFEIKETVPAADMNWMASQKTFYYPLMSRLDLYLSGVELSGKTGKELREDELYYDSCINFNMTEDIFGMTGFGGLYKQYAVKPVEGTSGFEVYTDDTESVVAATCYTTLTDGKIFAVAACCCVGNQMTWGVTSTLKILPEETVNQIHDHVESLGFKREYFTGLRYDTCGDMENPLKNDEL